MHTQIALRNLLFFQHVCSLWLRLRHLRRDNKAILVIPERLTQRNRKVLDTQLAALTVENAYGLFPSSTFFAVPSDLAACSQIGIFRWVPSMSFTASGLAIP